MGKLGNVRRCIRRFSLARQRGPQLVPRIPAPGSLIVRCNPRILRLSGTSFLNYSAESQGQSHFVNNRVSTCQYDLYRMNTVVLTRSRKNRVAGFFEPGGFGKRIHAGGGARVNGRLTARS